MHTSRTLLLIVILGVTLISCQNSTSNPISTDNQSTESQQVVTTNNNRTAADAALWGRWEIVIDLETGIADALPLRHASFTGNQNFHAPPGMIKLENIEINDVTGEIEADIGLAHMFPALKKYTGFDVMGVFMGDGNALYPGDYDLAIHGPNDQGLLNADGYTRWFNANEFKGVGEIPPMFGYNPGHMGTPGYKPTADLNGYKFYAEGLDLDEDEFQFLIDNSDHRAMFVEGDLVWRHFSMIFPEMPSTGEAKFQYAIIGHWEPNKNEPGPPVNVPDDFPPEANVDEAVVCDIQDSSTAWWDNGDFGGSVILDISPWDWSAMCDASTMGEYVIYVYSDAWNGAYQVDMTCIGLTEFYETFHAEIQVETLNSCDPLSVWVEVRYPLMDYSNKFGSPNYAYGDLAGYFLVEVPVACEAPMGIVVLTPNGGEEIWWGDDYEITWSSQYLTGLVNIEYSKDDFESDLNTIALGEMNDGSFLWEDVPIDISDTVKLRTTSVDFPAVNDDSDEYFSIVDHGWAETYGGTENETAYDVYYDTNLHVYITGYYETVTQSQNIFLRKYSEFGNLEWELTWGGISTDYGMHVETDSNGDIYLTGGFNGTVDFDPGSQDEYITSNGLLDAFLLKLTSTGAFIWVNTWGGIDVDEGRYVCVDSNGNAIVSGLYRQVVDFDPGLGFDYHYSLGARDCFISRFDSSGNWIWSRTWGGWNSDWCNGIDVDSSDNIYVTGRFFDAVDFDPSAGVTSHTSVQYWDIFLSRFDMNGELEWVDVWGGNGGDSGLDLIVDGSNVYISGYFQDTVDFDPGSNDDSHTSNGDHDAYLTCLNTSGIHQWTQSWGGLDSDRANGVTVDTSGNVFSSGHFNGTVDFEPGSGVTEFTDTGFGGAFYSKFDSSGFFVFARAWSGIGEDGSEGISVDQNGNVYVCGFFSDTVDFAPSETSCESVNGEYSSNGLTDAYINKVMADGCW